MITNKNKETSKAVIILENEIDKRYLESIAPKIVESLNKFLESEITYIWLDVGNNVYDFHMEIKTIDDKESSYDIYLQLKGNTLIGLYGAKGIVLSELLGEELVGDIIGAIANIKK